MKVRNKKINNRYVVALAVLVAVAGLITFLFAGQQTPPQAVGDDVSQNKQQPGDHVTYTGKKDMTALAQLKQEVADVTTKTSTYGEYVETIGNYRGGQDGRYWSFYVDGKLATVGADAYVSKGGERIEWKFEKLQ